MKRIAVIGLGFGDEGKGMVTSSLALLNEKSNPLIVRYSGGHQAAHNVVKDDVNHIFSNFGSGTLHGFDTYWSDKCTVDPVGIMNEYKILHEKIGDSIYDVNLYINANAPVTTPYDKVMNTEEANCTGHGTCGVGFGTTLQREEDRVTLHFSDLYNPTVLMLKLDMIRSYYTDRINDIDSINMIEFIQTCIDITDTDQPISQIVNPVKDCRFEISTCKILEGSQGLLLDKDIGFFPHVTRSNVGLKQLRGECDRIDDIYYVTRTYQTRHGAGPMTNEHIDLTLQNVNETNLTNDNQGDFRTTILDLDLLNYALQQDSRSEFILTKKNLVITCLDHIVDYQFTEYGELFTYDNEHDFIAGIKAKLKFRGNIYLSRSAKSELELWKEVKS